MLLNQILECGFYMKICRRSLLSRFSFVIHIFGIRNEMNKCCFKSSLQRTYRLLVEIRGSRWKTKVKMKKKKIELRFLDLDSDSMSVSLYVCGFRHFHPITDLSNIYIWMAHRHWHHDNTPNDNNNNKNRNDNSTINSKFNAII